jgi:plasmid maintenance system antidote protein VapI
MKNSIDILNAVKAKTGAASDYALAKTLHTSTTVISNYMTKNRVLSDDIAVRAATVLEIDASIVLALVHVENAKSDTEKRAWIDLLERLGGVAAALVLGIGLSTTPAPIQANSGVVSYNSAHSLYIMLNRKRKSKGFNPFESMVNQILSMA